jgi:hypothetical protein
MLFYEDSWRVALIRFRVRNANSIRFPLQVDAGLLKWAAIKARADQAQVS